MLIISFATSHNNYTKIQMLYVAYLITKQLVADTLTSNIDSTTGELRQELEADLCRLLHCSTDPSLSVSLPPMTVSRLRQDLWPIVIDDSQSARRLASSLSLALKLLGCDEARNKHCSQTPHAKQPTTVMSLKTRAVELMRLKKINAIKNINAHT